MARFLNRLKVEEVDQKGSGRWRGLAPLLYHSDIVREPLIVVPRGFVSDFGSVPRLPFAYAWFGNIAQAPAFLHDWLYTSHEISRRKADGVLREAMKSIGVSWIQRNAWWLGVRLFGGSHW